MSRGKMIKLRKTYLSLFFLKDNYLSSIQHRYVSDGEIPDGCSPREYKFSGYSNQVGEWRKEKMIFLSLLLGL